MRISVVTFLFLVLTSCKEQPKKDYSSPPGYDINKPEKIKVKEILDEISGIVYDKKNNALIAVNDEQGKLFSIDLANTFDYKISKFGGSGDYEDIAYTGKEWYVLKSNGDIYLMKNISFDLNSGHSTPVINLLVVAGTFILLFTKMRSPFIVMACLLLGWLF